MNRKIILLLILLILSFILFKETIYRNYTKERKEFMPSVKLISETYKIEGQTVVKEEFENFKLSLNISERFIAEGDLVRSASPGFENEHGLETDYEAVNNKTGKNYYYNIISWPGEIIYEIKARLSVEEINATKNETEKFLGDKDGWGRIKMELQDVQGLNGGRNIVVSGSGKTTIKIVRSDPLKNFYGFYQKTYEVTLEYVELNSLIELFIKNDFRTIIIENRLGIPDEPRPKIILTNPDGESHSVEVWFNDMQKKDAHIGRFANIYGRFMGIELGADGLTPVSEGVWR